MQKTNETRRLHWMNPTHHNEYLVCYSYYLNNEEDVYEGGKLGAIIVKNPENDKHFILLRGNRIQFNQWWSDGDLHDVMPLVKEGFEFEKMKQAAFEVKELLRRGGMTFYDKRIK